MRYPVVIHKDKASDYGVTVPDLPGCFSAGDTMEDALTSVIEAIEWRPGACIQCQNQCIQLTGLILTCTTTAPHGIFEMNEIDFHRRRGDTCQLNAIGRRVNIDHRR